MKSDTEVDERLCKFCGVILSEENQYPSMRKTFVCKKCHNTRTVVWQKAHHVEKPKKHSVPDKECLYSLYVDERKTLADIGDVYDTSETTVRNWLIGYDITLRTMSESWNIRREKHCEMFGCLGGVDREETIKRFGYDPIDITRGSDKLIVVVCPECAAVREICAHGYTEGQLCMACAKIGERHPMWGKHSAMLGKKHTEESKKKISTNRIGKCVGEDNHNYGKHLSDIAKEKLRATMTGRKKTEEQKQKMRGENAPNWRGGITPNLYCDKWTEELRESIREKFGRKCFICGKNEEENGARLSVHHTNSGKLCMCNYSCELVPLCKSCHAKTEYNRFYWYSLIMCKLLLESSAQYSVMDLCF